MVSDSRLLGEPNGPLTSLTSVICMVILDNKYKLVLPRFFYCNHEPFPSYILILVP